MIWRWGGGQTNTVDELASCVHKADLYPSHPLAFALLLSVPAGARQPLPPAYNPATAPSPLHPILPVPSLPSISPLPSLPPLRPKPSSAGAKVCGQGYIGSTDNPARPIALLLLAQGRHGDGDVVDLGTHAHSAFARVRRCGVMLKGSTGRPLGGAAPRWRRGRDLNPRSLAAHALSRRAR